MDAHLVGSVNSPLKIQTKANVIVVGRKLPEQTWAVFVGRHSYLSTAHNTQDLQRCINVNKTTFVQYYMLHVNKPLMRGLVIYSRCHQVDRNTSHSHHCLNATQTLHPHDSKLLNKQPLLKMHCRCWWQGTWDTGTSWSQVLKIKTDHHGHQWLVYV